MVKKSIVIISPRLIFVIWFQGYSRIILIFSLPFILLYLVVLLFSAFFNFIKLVYVCISKLFYKNEKKSLEFVEHSTKLFAKTCISFSNAHLL